MEFEYRRLFNLASTLADDGTYRIPIAAIGGCTRLDLKIRGTNGASGNSSAPIRGILTKVTLRLGDGSDHINMSATELMALDTLITGIAPQAIEADTADLVQEANVHINLARFIRDDKFGLDLVKCNGAELILEYQAATYNAVGATGFVSKSVSFELSAWCTADPGSPRYAGRIMPARLINNKATTITRDFFDMPQWAPIVSVFLYAYKSGSLDGELIESVALEEPNRRRTYVNATFPAIQQTRQLAAGTVVSYWCPVAVVPGRMGEAPIASIGQTGLKITVNELVAAGVWSLFAEYLEVN